MKMKSTYINPEVQIMNIAEEDVIRTSSNELMQGEFGRPDNFAWLQAKSMRKSIILLLAVLLLLCMMSCEDTPTLKGGTAA